MKTTVYVVVTTINDGERDLFGDVVLVTKNENEARKFKTKLLKHTYNKKEFDWLGDYDSAAYFERLVEDEKDQDTITVSWCTEDILGRAEEQGIKLTKKQARKILADIDRGHDASVGISWDVIDSYLQNKEF